MAKKLVKALAEQNYTASIVGIVGTFTDMGVAQKVVFKAHYTVPTTDTINAEQYEEMGAPAIDFYTLKIEVEGRILTVNKFANKVVWTDKDGNGWTQLDFFTSGLQRQLGLEDETDDVVILSSAEDVKLYIAPYTNPRTGAFSYNIDSTAPKKVQVAEQFDI